MNMFLIRLAVLLVIRPLEWANRRLIGLRNAVRRLAGEPPLHDTGRASPPGLAEIDEETA